MRFNEYGGNENSGWPQYGALASEVEVRPFVSWLHVTTKNGGGRKKEASHQCSLSPGLSVQSQSPSGVELNPALTLTALMCTIGNVEPLTWILLSSGFLLCNLCIYTVK